MTSLSKSSSNSSWMLESCVARCVWVCLPSSLLQAKMAISLSLVLVSIQWAVTPKYDFLLADQQSAVVATNAAALILLEKKKKKRLSQGKLWWSSKRFWALNRSSDGIGAKDQSKQIVASSLLSFPQVSQASTYCSRPHSWNESN